MAGTAAVPDMRLELVPLPVSDVERAKAFYEQVGFGNVHDTQVTDAMRVVQLTPPGSRTPDIERYFTQCQGGV
jgi:catechol 2,3-dioxygenase-like lactoylglutathione lyase family enzyme